MSKGLHYLPFSLLTLCPNTEISVISLLTSDPAKLWNSEGWFQTLKEYLSFSSPVVVAKS